MTGIDRDAIYRTLRDYIQEQFLGESGISVLEPDTPLLEWGVLTSMNTSLLLAYVRTEFGVAVPPGHITSQHFRDLTSITDMVHGLWLQPA